MKIAVIGVGNVGAVLSRRWAQNGHQIFLGVRDPHSEKVQKLLKTTLDNAQATSVVEAVAASEVVVLATPWEATAQIIAAAGDLSGKIVVDCTNPIKPNLDGLSIGLDNSAGELVAQWAKGAQVVKAFNSTGAGNMANPVYAAGRVTMYICGNEAEAKKVVAGLANELGFEAIDTGDLTMSRYLEPLAMVWIKLAYVQGLGADFALNVVRR